MLVEIFEAAVQTQSELITETDEIECQTEQAEIVDNGMQTLAAPSMLESYCQVELLTNNMIIKL